jgi:hypothetical protein
LPSISFLQFQSSVCILSSIRWLRWSLMTLMIFDDRRWSSMIFN